MTMLASGNVSGSVRIRREPIWPSAPVITIFTSWPCAASRRRGRSACRLALLQPVAVVVDRHHPEARLDAQVELLAHLADVGVHGARREVAGAAPDRLLQVPARHQAADIAKQDHREFVFLGGELDLGAGAADFAALCVDLEGGERELLVLLV